ncbi:MAG: D-amino acid dehydrogenase [Rickettsiales bacterium]|jgi:D-amino-acid dehydrogenase|nr:D-amino acid dehydrogenase [Rickettsiales bacterium]
MLVLKKNRNQLLNMNILVLGAGLLGVSTAYELGRRGFKVTVVDRQSQPAAEGSFSNGAQLSYSHAEPWASPHVLPKIPFWILNPSAPLVYRPRADLAMTKWGLQFLRNCTSARAAENAINILRLGLFSREKLAEIRAATGIEFHFSNRGILRIYGNKSEFDHACRHSELEAKYGCKERIVSRDECLAIEPVLAHTNRTIYGGIHAILDEVGDAKLYCDALADYASKQFGVVFRYGVDVQAIQAENKTIRAIKIAGGDISADGFVMAMGAYSAPLLKTIGITLPVYPMKGYSLTLKANDYCPISSITDGEYKIVHTRIGDQLRIAGTAEFTGYNHDISEHRIQAIIKAGKTLLPKAAWDSEISRWACLRPSTPDGPPVLGKTPYANLFLNTGHGTLGWTHAAGSASIVADCVEGKPPPINMQGYTLR